MLDLEEQREIRQAWLIIANQLPDREQFELERSQFQEKFGSQALSRLVGTTLLKAMFSSDFRDSLCNQLEFYFHSFGYAVGKMGPGVRTTPPNEEPRWQYLDDDRVRHEISIDQAIDLSVKYLHQLARAVEILQDLPCAASDEVYEDLQNRLDVETPDISSAGWAHKYLSILFPEKLTPLHSEEIQRFYLQKRLQIPPSTRGLYASEGRFIAIARQASKTISLTLNQLVHALIELHGKPYRYWAIAEANEQSTKSREDDDPANLCIHVPVPKHRIRHRDMILLVDQDNVLRFCRVEHACRCCNHLEVFPLPADNWKLSTGIGLPGTVIVLDEQPQTIIEMETRMQSFLGKNMHWVSG